MTRRPQSSIEIEPLLEDFGAIVHGVDFRDPDAVKPLLDAAHAHGVIFLRDQKLGDAEHIESARRFGELGVYPLQAAAGAFEPLEFIEDGPDDPPKADGWHTDLTWIESPPVMAFLMRHATAAERAVRWRWKQHDFVIWDERRTMHRALGDHYPQHRKVRRCTVLGECPEAASTARIDLKRADTKWPLEKRR